MEQTLSLELVSMVAAVALIAFVILLVVHYRLRQQVKNRKALYLLTDELNVEYKKIVENLQDVYFRSTFEGEVKIISDSVNHILGFDKEEMIGTLSTMYTQPEIREKFLQALADNDGYLIGHEAPMVAKDGTQRWICVNAQYIYDEDGRPVGIEGTAKNITERKAVEGQLMAARKRLMQLIS